MTPSVFKYVVLRLAPDFMRGESINVGIALFPPEGGCSILFLANQKKLQTVDLSWTTAKITEWHHHVQEIADQSSDIESCIQSLSRFGYCASPNTGMFFAPTDKELKQEIQELSDLYITPKGFVRNTRKKRQPRLISELRQQFKNRQILGESVEDLRDHLVVSNVPIPEHPDLKADFVFKNGVYRITQTLDYRVSTQGAHNKISEACTKTVAAQFAKKAWGEDTLKLAVVNVPEEVADVADPHIDMLIAQGFSVFHATDASDLEKYHFAVTGAPGSDEFILSHSMGIVKQ